jgi:TBC1 domain family protein 5
MRLLFGREFSMQDLLVVWDAIFAEGISFSLCDYIFVAMLLVIRRLLIASDYSKCLGYLMRFPTVPDVHHVIDMALYLKDPMKYNEPNSYSPHILPSPVNFDEHPRRREALVFKPSTNSVLRPPTLTSRPHSLSLPAKSALDNEANSTQSFQRNSSLDNKANPVSLARPVAREMKQIPSESMSSQSNNIKSQVQLDYCWKHLTLQIDTLQKCLSQEGLKNEDEIFVALAELKKVRDILQGSLKIAKELANVKGASQ